jgi:medium-chain acyl-[acyl-carrier-protein] hydrolase
VNPLSLPHSEHFDVRSYDVNASGRLGVRALCVYLQEAAGNDARRLDVSMNQLLEQDLAWMLHRLRLAIVAGAPTLPGSRLSVATWARRFERVIALRDFEVRDEAGALLAAATSRWVVVDPKARKVVRLPPFIRGLPVPDRPPALEMGDEALPALGASPACERRFEVRRSDLDVLQHVNNTRYVGWAVETVPEDVYETRRLAEITIVFQREAAYGDVVVSRSQRLEGLPESTFAHELSTESGRVLAQATTAWVREA